MAFCQFLPTFSNIRIKRLLLISNVLQIQSFKLPWSRAATISEDKDILSLLGEFASLDQENSEPFHLHFNQSCMKNGNWGLYSRIHIYNSKQDCLFSHMVSALCFAVIYNSYRIGILKSCITMDDLNHTVFILIYQYSLTFISGLLNSRNNRLLRSWYLRQILWSSCNLDLHQNHELTNYLVLKLYGSLISPIHTFCIRIYSSPFLIRT